MFYEGWHYKSPRLALVEPRYRLAKGSRVRAKQDGCRTDSTPTSAPKDRTSYGSLWSPATVTKIRNKETGVARKSYRV
jgi:hypothetical protein